jgi:hypothetical protein
MVDPIALEYADFEKKHLPNLYKFVIAIAHEDEHGKESLGSGVLINLNDRHFIATARHCIERNPRLIHDSFVMLGDRDRKNLRFQTDRSIPILKKDWHPRLDVGFLEIARTPGAAMTRDQLCFGKPVSGLLHVIGHPTSKLEWSDDKGELILNRCSFGTKKREIDDDLLKLEYPREGLRLDNGQWLKGQEFPDPKGFSGGGCFGVTKSFRADLQIIEYSLLGIQYAWNTVDAVKVVPIRRWFDLVERVL